MQQGRTLHKEEQSGFSLLEMVIALGVLIVLTVGGVLAYSGIQNSSRKAATLAAAKSVYTEAVAYDLDNNGSTKPTDAADEYNVQGQAEGEEPTIKAEVHRMESGALCAVAVFIEHEISEVAGANSVDECRGVVAPSDPDSEGENSGSNDSLEGGLFVSKWDTSKEGVSCLVDGAFTGKSIRIPLRGKIDVRVDWGDGYVTTHTESNE